MRHILLFILLPFFSFAQAELTETHTAVFFNKGVSKSEQINSLEKQGIDKNVVTQFGSRDVVLVPNSIVEVNALRSDERVEYISPVFMNEKQQFVTYQSSFFVKLNQINDRVLVDREAQKIGVEVLGANRFNADIIELKADKFGIDAIDAVNHFKATGLFAIVSPNLMHTVSDCSVDDPRYNRQWNLKNDGSSLQGNGTIGADMDAEAAWTITTGSPNVKIAIVDSGVDTLHPELLGKLLPGFDAFDAGTNGYPIPNFPSDGHGTACAGIAAATTNNNLGVAGVCRDCRVIPIRVFEYVDFGGTMGVIPWSTTDVFINGLSWMWQEGDADVSSNSWGVPDGLLALFPGGDTLVNAIIDDAIEQGRGGLGIPMLFSSGNDGITDSIPIWPARYAPTIAVGATSMCDQHKSQTSCDGESWWAGNWGEGLDVSAPGVRIATIDMLGTNGFHSTEYYNSFNGTSAACPNAAGTMGLILSHTPGLPEWLARKVLSSTSEKVGGYDYSTWKEAGSWSQELGYGRINAFQAVTYGASAVGELSSDSNFLVETHIDKHIIRTSDNTQIGWQLFDINGRILRSGNANGSVNLSHSGLSAGMYALRMQGDKLQETVKLFIP
ncbi:MAG: S8 family peptidase [Flavobacteriales bacterium]|nr:S8 family peptidase [Flavobacteriales bacterium]